MWRQRPTGLGLGRGWHRRLEYPHHRDWRTTLLVRTPRKRRKKPRVPGRMALLTKKGLPTRDLRGRGPTSSPSAPSKPPRSATVAPDRGAVLRDREVEALVGERRMLGVRVHERKGETELSLEPLRASWFEELSRLTTRAPRRINHAET